MIGILNLGSVDDESRLSGFYDSNSLQYSIISSDLSSFDVEILQVLILSGTQKLPKLSSLNLDDIFDQQYNEEEAAIFVLIEKFLKLQKPNKKIIGLGMGSLILCKFFNGNIKKLNTCKISIDKCKCENCEMYFPRIYSSSFETIPLGSKILVEKSEEIVGFQFDEERAQILALNFNLDVSMEDLVDEYFPKYENLMEYEDAMSSLESFKEFAMDEEATVGLDYWIEILRTMISSSAVVVGDSSKLVSTLQERIQVLENENRLLKEQLGMKIKKKENDQIETNAVKALLFGLPIESTEEEILNYESFLIRSSHGLTDSTELLSLQNTSSVLCIAYTNEGDLLYAGTDRIFRHRFPGGEVEEFKLDAPPVSIVVLPYSVPSQICVAMLSGCVEKFVVGIDGTIFNDEQRKLPSPHKKHIMGITYDPSGENRLCTISRDGILCLWENDQVKETLIFQENKPPECCTSVIFKGESFVAVAKRNDNRISLIPFDSSKKFQTYFNLNEDEDHPPSFCPLAMSSFKNLPVLAVATDKSRIILYDVRNFGKKIREFWGHNCDEFARPSICWHPKGSWIICSSTPSSIFCFQVANSRREPVVIKNHSAAVRGLICQQSLSDLSSVVLTSASFDKQIKVQGVCFDTDLENNV